MENPFRKDEIFSVLRETAAEVLACTLQEIEYDTAIVNDLGADSLDFVEITCHLENKLNITLPTKSVLEHVADKIGKDVVYSNGTEVTDDALYFLENSFSRFSNGQIRIGMTMHDIGGMATFGDWTNLCHALFNYLPALCPGCRHDTAVVSPSRTARCESCGSPIRPLSGDHALSQYTAVLIHRWKQDLSCRRAVEAEDS